MRFTVRNSVRGFLLALALALAFFGYSGRGHSSRGNEALPTATASNAAAVNTAPRIVVDASSPAHAGVRYELQPAVANLHNERLTFSADNLPPWASIDATSGKITGTPKTTDIGDHEAIIIKVADAGQRAATMPFTISVIGSGEGVARLDWQRPSSKVDGSALDDLAGYRICYGRDPDDLDHSVFISDPSQTSYEFSTLEAGVWYFAVISVNANGLEGPSNGTARKVI